MQNTILKNKKYKYFYKNNEICYIFIRNTRNNIVCSVSNPYGDIYFWYSTRTMYHLSGKQKLGHASVADMAKLVLNDCKYYKFNFFNFIFKGKVNNFKKIFNYFLQENKKNSFQIMSVVAKQPIPFNGCRLPKRKNKRYLLRKRIAIR